MTFFSDTLKGTATLLQDWTPDTLGDSWTQIYVAGVRSYQVIASGIRSSGNSGDSGFIYTADVTYPSANYEVEFTLVATVTSIVPVYVFARIQDAENMYGVRLIPSTGTCQLYKKVAGTWGALGDLFDAPANGSVCKLIISGSTLSFEDDTVEIESVTDSDISAAGKAGVGMGGGAELVTSTDDVSATVVISDFSITDLGGGAADPEGPLVGGKLVGGGILVGGRLVR